MWGKDDEEYVDPLGYSGRPRGSCESARQTVQNNQGYGTDKFGNVGFMVADPRLKHAKANYLNKDGTDPTYKDHHGNTRRPVLDHIIQYAALDEAYEQRVVQERNKGAEGRTRRNSVDLFNAFKSAAVSEGNKTIGFCFINGVEGRTIAQYSVLPFTKPRLLLLLGFVSQFKVI